MYDMDKEKFGAFVAQLRRERGLTQKELADKLYISNKAVSKWETGVSIPDVGLLIPLSEVLGVTVTELLSGERQSEHMDTRQVEDVVKKAISYAEEAPRRSRQEKRRMGLIYGCCLLLTLAEVAALYFLKLPVNYEYLLLVMIFGVVFGWYFMLGAMQKLPDYYDSHRINGTIDGPFRMNIPGVRFTNGNWPYILRCGQIWSMTTMVIYPILTGALSALFPAHWHRIEMYVLLVLILGGLFIPMVIVGKKYE